MKNKRINWFENPENEMCKDAQIFLYKLALARLQKGGNDNIPLEIVDFVNACFTNGIKLEIKEK